MMLPRKHYTVKPQDRKGSEDQRLKTHLFAYRSHLTISHGVTPASFTNALID